MMRLEDLTFEDFIKIQKYAELTCVDKIPCVNCKMRDCNYGMDLEACKRRQEYEDKVEEVRPSPSDDAFRIKEVMDYILAVRAFAKAEMAFRKANEEKREANRKLVEASHKLNIFGVMEEY
jgi:hypothetical protein